MTFSRDDKGRFASEPAPENHHPPLPHYPGPDYCSACGLTTRHAPGCPGTAPRNTSPHWRP